MNRLIVPHNFDSFIGNSRALEILRRALTQDHLPHAMIFAGPPGVGKCTLALLVAKALNCEFPVQSGSCGNCSSCKRIAAVMESRYLSCETIEGGFCGSCASCKIKTKRHPDIRLVEPEKTTISIDQVRDMINEIAYQPLEARYRVVILDPAEQMRLEAHNSLLKTLEEPPSRTIIILIATNPYMLLDTIRSRSRLLHFGEISQESIERQLVVQQGRKKEEARLAAALSGGSLAAALSFNVDEYRETRALALEFVSLVLRNGSFVEASAIAMQVAKDKEFFGEWIESASALLRDVYYCKFDAEKIGQRDLQARIVELAQKSSRSSLVKVINAIDKLKADLQFSVNRQIALEAAFLGLAGRDNRRSAEDRTPRH